MNVKTVDRLFVWVCAVQVSTLMSAASELLLPAFIFSVAFAARAYREGK